VFEEAEFDGRDELYFLAGFSDFDSFLEVLVVGCELLVGIEALGFFVEGEDLAFDIFGYDIDFVGDLFFNFVPNRINIQGFLAVQ
jgi:hypothetical protein